MSKILLVPIIMACSLVGTVVLIFLCGSSIWAFKYLICHRLLKRPATRAKDEIKAAHDIIAISICLITLAIVAALLIYGMPIVIEYLPKFGEIMSNVSAVN